MFGGVGVGLGAGDWVGDDDNGRGGGLSLKKISFIIKGILLIYWYILVRPHEKIDLLHIGIKFSNSIPIFKTIRKFSRQIPNIKKNTMGVLLVCKV